MTVKKTGCSVKGKIQGFVPDPAAISIKIFSKVPATAADH
jgi:hypothetical protein